VRARSRRALARRSPGGRSAQGRSRALLLVLALLLGCAGTEEPPAQAPDDAGAAYERYMEAGRRWERSGSPDAAALYFGRAVRTAERLPQPDIRLARARFELGDALRRQARLEEAIVELDAARGALRPIEAEHPELRADILDALGYCQLGSGDAEAAVATLATALRIRVEEIERRDAALAETLVDLAEAEYRSGDDDKALTLLVEAAYVYGELGPEYRIRLATVHDNMGRYAGGLGRTEEAERLHLRAIELARRVKERDNPNVAIFQRNLANLYVETGRDEEAEALYRESLATLERTVGSEHYETRATRSMLERWFPESEEEAE